MDGDESPIPMINAHGDSESPNIANMNGLGPRRFDKTSYDVREVAITNLLRKCMS